MKAKTEMILSEQVSLFVSTLIQCGPQVPQTMPALRPGESVEQAHARVAALTARIAAQR